MDEDLLFILTRVSALDLPTCRKHSIESHFKYKNIRIKLIEKYLAWKQSSGCMFLILGKTSYTGKIYSKLYVFCMWTNLKSKHVSA